MPFEWTINPYRGCSHACVYCLAGDTPILMADGATRPLADLRVGDASSAPSARRRLPPLRAHRGARPLVHRQTGLPGHPGRRHPLVASGDHRFLSDRGWKHVTGARPGGASRPHLTTGEQADRLRRASPSRPTESPEYRRGYLLRLRARRRPRRPVRAGRLAPGPDLARRPAGRAARRWPTTTASPARGERHVAAALDRSTGPAAEPRLAAGFLAGLFDAERQPHAAAAPEWHRPGLCRQGASLDWLVRVLTVARVRHRSSDGALSRSALGGLPRAAAVPAPDRPGVTPHGTVAGERGEAAREPAAWPTSSRSGVELPMFDITTGTGDFIANGVVSHNCFARNTHSYLDLDTGHDFDSQIVVKVNAARAAAPRAGRAALAGRARRDGHQRRLLPARRGPLPADAGHPRARCATGRTPSRS